MRNPISKKVMEIEPSGIRKFFDIVRPYLKYIPKELKNFIKF